MTTPDGYHEAKQEWLQRRQRAAQDECPHTDHECGVCIECGKDITDNLVSRAEAAADAAQDR